MRFVLVSTHVDQTTGYSKVVINLLKQLTKVKNVKTYHFGFQRHPERKSMRKVSDGVTCYDAAANEDPKEEGFGFNKIYEYLDMVNPDVVMIYNDPLIIAKFIEAMKYKKDETPYKLWVYVDQVYKGIAPPLIEAINKNAEKVFCFSEEWAAQYKAYGEGPPVYVMGHAVDSVMFSRLPKDVRSTMRKNMNVSDDAVIFLNANRNSERKRLDLSIMGFVQLIKRNPTAPYYMLFVTGANPQHGSYYDISRVFSTEVMRLGLKDVENIEKRVIILDTSPPNVVSDETINQLYNTTDVGVNTADGEGFGLCQLEHLFVGAPQIVTDVGVYRSFMPESTTEFIHPNGISYMSGTMPLGLIRPTFTAEAVGDAMERMVKTLREKKVAASSVDFPTWDTVCNDWITIVKSVST